jgi:beta-galactosidase
MTFVKWAVLSVTLLCMFTTGCGPAAAPDAPVLAPGAAGPRQILDLDSGWRFIRQDVSGADQSAFDDSAWQSVNLPHTWNALDGQDGGNNYYRGPGWYRRHLTIPADLAGRSLFLKFDAASMVADVYVNGHHVGGHKGAFAAFIFDVTDQLNPSADNIIAVRVDNSHNIDVPTLAGDFTIFGGLYRSVHLLALDKLSITPLDDAGPGVYATQDDITADTAKFHVTAKLRNATGSDKTAGVVCQIIDAGGNAVQTVQAQQLIAAGGNADVVQNIVLPNPHLWNGRTDPYLYTVRVTISDGSSITDFVDQPLGLRFFKVDPDQGFFLNGRPYALHGVNRHQDRINMGWAITPAQHKEDFDLIMEMGCTAVRLAHYQHAQEFYDLCDRGGLVVWAEACLVNEVTASDAFDNAAMEQVQELIKQNYNHPSICFWSLFNELRSASGPAHPERDAALRHQLSLVGKLNQLAHSLDATRLTTAASNLLDPLYPRNRITDVIGFNGYFGWYNGAPSQWPAQLDALHLAAPNREIGISEYGAGASAWQHEANPTQPKANLNPWHPEEWQDTVHEDAWQAMQSRQWLWGTFLWNMFDFASDGRNEGDQPGRNDKGLVTYDRKTKKDAFYFYKANWSSDPFTYITGRRYTPRNQPTTSVKIYSNCDSVELKVNGHSLGSRTPDDIHRLQWDNVPLRPGDNQFQAVGTQGDRQFTDACVIVMDPSAPNRVTTPLADRP